MYVSITARRKAIHRHGTFYTGICTIRDADSTRALNGIAGCVVLRIDIHIANDVQLCAIRRRRNGFAGKVATNIEFAIDCQREASHVHSFSRVKLCAFSNGKVSLQRHCAAIIVHLEIRQFRSIVFQRSSGKHIDASATGASPINHDLTTVKHIDDRRRGETSLTNSSYSPLTYRRRFGQTVKRHGIVRDGCTCSINHFLSRRRRNVEFAGIVPFKVEGRTACQECSACLRRCTTNGKRSVVGELHRPTRQSFSRRRRYRPPSGSQLVGRTCGQESCATA